jgi:elongation factor Ts
MISPFTFGMRRQSDKQNRASMPPAAPSEAPAIRKALESSPTISYKSSTSMITTEQIKALRDQTGVSVMQCKKALEEAGGDEAKALVILRKKSGELAAKKGDRTFSAGTIQAYVHANGNVASMVELNCETDFVSNNDAFKTLARDIAMHVAATNPKFLSRADITENDKKVAREVFEGEVKGKPEAVRNQILEGKLNAYFAEMVLLDQPYIRNPEVTIQALLDAAVQKFGEKTAIARFVCFKVLQG